jgi:hypothetical protein
MKSELLGELSIAQEILKDFDKFKHLFSDDESEVTLAKLNRTIQRLNFLVKISELKDIEHPKNKPLLTKKSKLISIRPCDEKYGNKTYVGFLLGEMATGSSISISDDKIQCEWSGYNPAIFVPELGEVIYGYESWWGTIDSIEELKEITNEDIDNVWYVKLLKDSLLKDEQNNNQ